MLWDDVGPASQGKIVTAILQDRDQEARQMLRRWTSADRRTLQRALRHLDRMIEVIEHREAMKG